MTRAGKHDKERGYADSRKKRERAKETVQRNVRKAWVGRDNKKRENIETISTKI